MEQRDINTVLTSIMSNINLNITGVERNFFSKRKTSGLLGFPLTASSRDFLALENGKYAADLMCAVSAPFLLQYGVSTKS